MPGVPRQLAEHTLNVDPKYRPVKQFLRRFNEERRKAIGEEVARLLAAGFIIEVFHPEWLANPVLVLKKNGTWRMCVDYTNLNRPALQILLPSPVLIKSLMLRRVASVYVFWMHTMVIIRLKWQLRTRRRRRSLLPLEPSAMYLCLLGSRVPRQLINGVCKIVSTNRSAVMCMPMWTILWSSQGR